LLRTTQSAAAAHSIDIQSGRGAFHLFYRGDFVSNPFLWTGDLSPSRPEPDYGYYIHTVERPPWYPGIQPNSYRLTWTFAGFQLAHQYDINGPYATRIVSFTVPYWFLAIMFAPPPLLWLRRRRAQRRAGGRCRVCGYDLRATPDRCPECGTETQKTATA
jgi:hypothetical protein